MLCATLSSLEEELNNRSQRLSAKCHKAREDKDLACSTA